MFYASRKKRLAVQNAVLKVINNNCPDLKAYFEGPRHDRRVNLTLVVLVVPLVDGKLEIDDAFYAVTRDLSVTGAGIVLDRKRSLNEVVVGFSMGDDLTLLQATVIHVDPMGCGFYCLGLEMTEVVPGSKYPELKALKF